VCRPSEVHRYEKHHKRHTACAYYVASRERLRKEEMLREKTLPKDITPMLL
jgi:hypothetical protein